MPEIIDAHVHLQLAGEEPMAGAEHPLQTYQQAISGTTVGRFGVLVMAPLGDPVRTRQLNDAALGVPDQDRRAFALCSVHPDDGADALTEIDRVAAAGAAGLKLHPGTQGFDVAADAVRTVVEHAGRHRLPVLFDSVSATDPGQPEKLIGLAMQCPGTDIVLAHTFGPKFPQAVMFPVLSRYPGVGRNVYLELSAIVSMFSGGPFAEQLVWICRRHGLDRVLWGSDYPLFGPAESWEALAGLGFSAGELDQIGQQTAAALYSGR